MYKSGDRDRPEVPGVQHLLLYPAELAEDKTDYAVESAGDAEVSYFFPFP